ncbi:MAG TPA: hypothetical protein VJ725_23305, partial [Thermoanaerobaculia bacterium]|nr:hypothetical protein [Thermoanaerobaculia bacterium]
MSDSVRDDLPRLDRSAFSVRPLRAESDEKQYWAQKTPQERLEALEQMRQILYGYDPATTRIERVLTVVPLWVFRPAG